MNWKQFLKPDWRKIVLTVIITISWILLLHFIISTTVVLCYTCPVTCPNGNYVNYLIVPGVCNCCVSLSEVYNNYLWNLIVPLIVSYIISCFIVWVYDKIIKKRIRDMTKPITTESSEKEIDKIKVRICPECKTENDSNSEFCKKCGNKLRWTMEKN